MQCFKCNRETDLKIHHLGKVCNYCFIDIIEKRVKSDLKHLGWFNKGDFVVVLDNGSFEASMSECLLKTIIKGLPVTIEKKSNLDELSPTTKIIIPWNLEMESNESLQKLFNNQFTQDDKRYIKLLESITEEEVDAFCKIKNLSGKRNSKKDLLAKIEKRYPGTRFAFLQGMKTFINP